MPLWLQQSRFGTPLLSGNVLFRFKKSKAVEFRDSPEAETEAEKLGRES